MKSRLRRLRVVEGALSRRLSFGSHFRADRVHPLRFVSEPRDGPKLRVALHSAFLKLPADDDEAASFRLLSDLRSEHYELFRTPGETAGIFGAVPAMTMDPDGSRIVLKAFGHEVHTGVFYPEQIPAMAEFWLGDAASAGLLVDLEAANALRPHVFITTSAELLAARDRIRSEAAILTPLEALPLLWSWTRAFGDHWDGHLVTSSWFYYWCLACAMTPVSRSAWPALVYGEFARPDGEELISLAQSITMRLASATEALDDMFRTWHLPAGNDTVDRICDRFDQIVLAVAALLDNLALLAVAYFGVTRLELHQKSLASVRFHNRLRLVGDPRASALADYLSAHLPRITLHSELRHHAVHRARLPGTRYQRENDLEEVRIRISEPTLGIVWDQLVAASEDPSEWGITNRSGPQDIEVSFVDRPGRKEMRRSLGMALLDPVAFAPRLIASTARVIDHVFDRLSIQNDPLLQALVRKPSAPDRERWPMREEDRRALILTSPLAGFVDLP